MITFTVHATGFEETIARLRTIPARAEAAQRTVIKRLGDRYLALLKEESPTGKGASPGGLVKAYKTAERYTAASAEYRITNEYPPLRWITSGRAAVEATRARALRFQIGGQVFYRKRVGAAAANRFDERAKTRMRGEVTGAAREIAARVVRP